MKRIVAYVFSLSKTKKILLIIVVATLGLLGYRRINTVNKATPNYQTANAVKDTLIVSVSVSGQVSSANSAEVTTQASGVVKTVYVKDGDTVSAGDKIAVLDLDLTGQQRSQQAYASYQSAQNNVESARANLYSSQAVLLTEWESYMSKAQNSTYENSDDTPNVGNRQLSDFVITKDEWLASEAKYKVQEKTILQAQTALSSAWHSYQQFSSTIVAPISGVITGLSLLPGTVITAQTNSSGGSSSQRIASVKTSAVPTIRLNITQIDAPKVKAGNIATLTFDAFPDKTYTGQVISIDTIGESSSGVTTYPAIIKLDVPLEGLLPNMSATANIITATKNAVLLIPSAAIQSQNGTTTVRILNNNKVSEVEIETGLTNDSQTEILSGLTEGQTVITSAGSGGTGTTSSTTTSPFNMFGRSGGSGGQIRMIR